MDPLTHFILELIAAVGTSAFASYFMILAHKRFLKGEFSNVIKWVTYTYVFMAIYKVSEMISEYTIVYQDLFMNIYHVSMLATIFCAIKSGFLLNKFSKVYGFKCQSH